MIVLGIDPGLSGAVALYNASNGALQVDDMPTHELKRGGKNKRELDLPGLAGLFDVNGLVRMAFVEQVGAMPGQGVSSVFAFGKAYGAVLGILAARNIPMTMVPPQRWKKALNVPAAKDGARARASQLLPSHAAHWKRVKDDGRAEAALIAYYGAQTMLVPA